MVVGSLINFLVGRFELVFSQVDDNAHQYASLGVSPSNRGVPFLFRFRAGELTPGETGVIEHCRGMIEHC